jgi:redox-sensing transcriptional repressor
MRTARKKARAANFSRDGRLKKVRRPRGARKKLRGAQPRAVQMPARRSLITSIPRLFLYHRGLADALREGDLVLTSRELATRIGRGISSTQIRKDLSYLGSFGRRGQGYDVAVLVSKLARVLGLDRDWRIAIVGFGNLGHALASFLEFREEKFHIAAVFDNDPKLVGTSWNGLRIHHVDELERALPDLRCGIGIITVPASAAQAVAERLVAAGVGALLNFAPCRLALTSGVALRSIDLASELSILTHHLS